MFLAHCSLYQSIGAAPSITWYWTTGPEREGDALSGIIPELLVCVKQWMRCLLLNLSGRPFRQPSWCGHRFWWDTVRGKRTTIRNVLSFIWWHNFLLRKQKKNVTVLTLETNFGSISDNPRERLLDGPIVAGSGPTPLPLAELLDTAAMTNALLQRKRKKNASQV